MITQAEPETIPSADIYILQGDDELSIQDYIKRLSAQLGEQGISDMNITRLDGRIATRAEINQTLNLLSLLSSQRLVILEQALDALNQKDAQPWLEEILAHLPETTVLILLIPDCRRYVKGEMVWEKVGEGHWLRQSLKDCGKRVEWKEKILPNLREMPQWILDEVKKQGGIFDGRAAAELANLVGNNLFQARHEISKALSYAGKGNTVTREDIRLLCSQSREEDIFAMVDAAGVRDARHALSLLQHLMQDLPTQYIFSMLARQIRLLIMAREVLDGGGGEDELVSVSHMHAFVAKKAINQCRHFSMAELEGIYRKLDHMDEESKIGNITLEVGMETLIADLSRKYK